MAPIVFENVHKSYGKKAALTGINLSIANEAITVLIGPSGGGKSTLIQMINGLIRPDGGRVLIFSQPHDYERLHETRKRMGYAVQGVALFPHLTVRKNISLLARLEKWEEQKIDRRIHELISLVNLPESYLKKYPHELSGGEQQRVGLCRAMMLDPKIFLLDEPFGALDPITRNEIHAEFLRLQKLAARTVVLVTHDLREAFKLGDHIVILNHGKIEQIGTGDDIIERPASEFVEQFVHSNLEIDFITPSDGIGEHLK
jgi:osmoprotectant transport system ATP-binding protein